MPNIAAAVFADDLCIPVLVRCKGRLTGSLPRKTGVVIFKVVLVRLPDRPQLGKLGQPAPLPHGHAEGDQAAARDGGPRFDHRAAADDGVLDARALPHSDVLPDVGSLDGGVGPDGAPAPDGARLQRHIFSNCYSTAERNPFSKVSGPGHEGAVLAVDVAAGAGVARHRAPEVRVRHQRVGPPVQDVLGDGRVGARVVHARRVAAPPDHVGEQPVAQLEVGRLQPHIVPPQLLVVEVVGEGHEHLRGAHIHVAVHQVPPQLQLRMLDEDAKRHAGAGLGRVVLEMHHLAGAGVEADHEVVRHGPHRCRRAHLLQHHGHHGSRVCLLAPPVLLDDWLQVDVRDDVPAHQHEGVGAHDPPLVDLPQGLAHRAAVRGLDAVHLHRLGPAAAQAGGHVGGDRVPVRDAEDEDLLHARGDQELEGVVQHWDVHQRQEDLGGRVSDWTEGFEERIG
mmetsp:Transcript_37657/g.65355  ORF Transcript_37657/g.65355 Transcript_37657/m.65355 type:complete len:450 (-) Transcript_37657:177-1526(-)